MSYYGFRPYVSVAKRREQAAREMAKLAKKGRVISPVAIEGRKIASTFWGKSWCENLESYSDYESRLPRGRTYVRNGSVVDLQIERGRVKATVSGSELYTITIEIGVLPRPRWDAICRDCAGSVGSLVELLQGKLSKNVMERVCRADDGLFPSPDEIKLGCSCPDWADMCKHVSAALYGVGARLDAKPELLFELRGVDRSQLIAGAGHDLPLTRRAVAEDRLLAEDDVAALFGIEIDAAPANSAADGVEKPARSLERGSAPPVPSAPVGDALKERSTGGRAAKPKAGSATTDKRAGAKGTIAKVASLEVSGRSTVAGAKRSNPSTLTSKRPAVVPQPVSTPPLAKTGRRVRILAVKSPRWKKPKAR
jgi:uncharacterized Zn finger protein